MVTMFVRHKVNNYDSWKRVYDETAPLQRNMGVTAATVHRDAKDPTTVIVVHKFKDMTSATSFVNSEDLKSAMTKAGVSGSPDIWFGEDIEATTP
jgi:quinol monooxygenase YgiN